MLIWTISWKCSGGRVGGLRRANSRITARKFMIRCVPCPRSYSFIHLVDEENVRFLKNTFRHLYRWNRISWSRTIYRKRVSNIVDFPTFRGPRGRAGAATALVPTAHGCRATDSSLRVLRKFSRRKARSRVEGLACKVWYRYRGRAGVQWPWERHYRVVISSVSKAAQADPLISRTPVSPRRSPRARLSALYTLCVRLVLVCGFHCWVCIVDDLDIVDAFCIVVPLFLPFLVLALLIYSYCL